MIPPGHTDTEEACHIASAIQRNFSELFPLEAPPALAYDAAGCCFYRMCCQAARCNEPVGITALEHHEDLPVTSMMQPLFSELLANPVVKLTGKTGLMLSSMAEWIDDLLDGETCIPAMHERCCIRRCTCPGTHTPFRVLFVGEPSIPPHRLRPSELHKQRERLPEARSDVGVRAGRAKCSPVPRATFS